MKSTQFQHTPMQSISSASFIYGQHNRADLHHHPVIRTDSTRAGGTLGEFDGKPSNLLFGGGSPRLKATIDGGEITRC